MSTGRLPARKPRAKLAARDRLVLEHLDWAKGIAAAVARRLPTWFTVDDLTGPAEIGLIQAADRYDAGRNDNFRAYAQARVYGACIASIRRREYRERSHFELEPKHTTHLMHPGPLPDQEAQASITRMALWRRVQELPPANARVLRSHYFRGLTLVKIAEAMGCSESWVCRLHREGLEMLRLRCRDLREAA